MDPTDRSGLRRPPSLDRRPADGILLQTTDGVERRRQLRRASDLTLRCIGSTLSALEYVGDGVILLDGSCTIIFMTDSAHDLLQACEEQIRVQNQRLVFYRKEDAGQIETYAKWTPPGGPVAGPGHTFLVARTPPRQPLIVSAFHLPPPASRTTPQPRLSCSSCSSCAIPTVSRPCRGKSSPDIFI